MEATNNGWTGRELEGQINSGLYERLLLSNDKKAVLEIARKQRMPEIPTEIIKGPMMLEFLRLKRDATYYEKDFESALITNLHLQLFLFKCSVIYRLRSFFLNNSTVKYSKYMICWWRAFILVQGRLFLHYGPDL